MSETETTSSPQQKQHWLAEQILSWSCLPEVYLRPTVFLDGFHRPMVSADRRLHLGAEGDTHEYIQPRRYTHSSDALGHEPER
jgi:uncharacterized protein YbjT (DUF2867 family)